MKSRNVWPVITLAILALVALPAAAVDPIVVDGNPNCESLGSTGYAFKIDPPNPGTYTFPDGNTITITTSDGVYFDFTSTFPLDTVIVKGGPNANVYSYSPEVLSDTGLHAPMNGDRPYGLSHIEVCYDYEVAVSKTAGLTYKKIIDWTIAKSVTPEDIHLFAGDSADALWTVTLTKSETYADFLVSGEITIANPDPMNAASLVSVTDVLSDGTNAAVSCPAMSIPSGGTLTCTYSATLSGLPAQPMTNTVTVTTSGAVGGGEDVEPVIVAPPTVEGDPEIVNVTDTNGEAWSNVGASTSFSYKETFTCNGDAGKHVNTATIVDVEPKESASADVDVTCWALEVQVAGEVTLEKDYRWTIDKSASDESLTLMPGPGAPVDYTIVLGAVSDDTLEAKGTITITNPSPIEVTVDVKVDLSDGSTAIVSCPSYTIPIDGGSITCTWTATPKAIDLSGTATVTMTGHSGSYSATRDIDRLESLIDECVTLSDTYEPAGLPAEFCVGGTLSFAYTRTFAYEACSETDITEVNTASFVTNDEAETGSDDATVVVKVPCDTGCTLTPGYWKTHSIYGPAPYDDTWAMKGEDTTFFLSGLSYYQVLWTVPAGGNPYYILAHAFIAAELNMANGASVPDEVQYAFGEAGAIFAVYTPDYIDSIKRSRKPVDVALRADMIAWAYILDAYNNGFAADGPPHCSE